MGRPRKELDAEQIVRFIGKGYYSEAIKKGRVFREGCLQAKQFHTAMVRNNVTMQIWLGKQWLKQTDKVAVEDDKPPLPLGMDQFE